MAAAQAVSAVAGAASRLSVEFVGGDGAFVRAPLESAWAVRFESRSPVRRVRTFKGQRNFDGLWWLATTGCHVGFESWLEREHLMLMDFDPDVVGVSSQPFWLHWIDVDGVERRHAPDFFARLADGSGVVVDVRPDERVTADAEDCFAVTADACEVAGWAFRRVGRVEPFLAANVRWLSGYRHPRCGHPVVGRDLLDAFGEARELGDGVAAVGDPIEVLPVLFHLLWTHALHADLDGARLCGSTVVASGGGM